MKHDEMIAVITHHKNGGKVQYQLKHKSIWEDFSVGIEPAWDFFDVCYRIKPEPLVIWLDLKPDNTVSAGCPFPFVSSFGRPVRKFVEVIE